MDASVSTQYVQQFQCACFFFTRFRKFAKTDY